jgi:hypothetical protein
MPGSLSSGGPTAPGFTLRLTDNGKALAERFTAEGVT